MPGRAKPKPRDWLLDPAQFGREPKPEWHGADPTTFAASQRRAAEAQHYVVLLIRERWIDVEGNTWAWVARQVTIPYDRLMEIVRGEQPLSLADLIELSKRFGPLLVASQELRQTAGLMGPEWPGSDGLTGRIR